MSPLTEIHDRHDATYTERGGRSVVAHYGRPGRAHLAVRNGAGFIERGEDVLVVTGDDRVEYVDNIVSNGVPTTEGRGVYALLLTPQGRIRLDMYIFNGGDRLLLFVPPGTGPDLAAEWSEKTFIQDVTIRCGTDEFGLFGVHGAAATEKIASVLIEQTPETRLSFVRGSMGDVGVTVIRMDGLTGEEGYEVICDRSDASELFDTLENRGLNAVPFGYRTWETLTLEAGTPLFETELEDAVPNNVGLHGAIDYEKGCFVGQEVVSRVANRGQPASQLVGLTLEAVPAAGASVFAGDEAVGQVTRAAESPSLEEPIAMALVDTDVVDEGTDSPAVTVRMDGTDRPASVVDLPFLETTERSGRVPRAEPPLE